MEKKKKEKVKQDCDQSHDTSFSLNLSKIVHTTGM